MYAIVAPIFAAFLASSYLCVLLFTRSVNNPILIVSALIMLATAWLLRPRLGRLPNDTIRRSEAPALFAVLDAIRSEVGGKRVNHLRIVNQFEASIGSYGLRGTQVVQLGAGFIAAFTPFETVGVLAHEQGHSANRDPGRSRLIYSTRTTLANVAGLLSGAGHDAKRFQHSEERLAGIALRGLATVANFVHLLLLDVTWKDRQTAELRADLGTARVVGTKAAIRQMEKFLLLDDIMNFANERAMHLDTSIADELAATYRAVPDRAREGARRKLADEPTAHVDVSHPPWRDRIDLLQRCGLLPHPPSESMITENSPLLQKLDVELRALSQTAIERMVVEIRDFNFKRFGTVPR